MKFKIFDKYASIGHIVTEKDLSAEYSFSMALHTGEDRDKIVSNRKRLGDSFGEESHYIVATQTHSDIVCVIDRHDDECWEGCRTPEEADALITNLPNTILTILTADCVPILLYDRVHHVVGAIHAGWRGTEQEIVSKTIAKMGEVYGSLPTDIVAGIGPSIGGCCYEVDDGVVNYFVDYPDSIVDKGRGKYQLDLKSINYKQLINGGLLDEHIETTPICTACQNDRFFSYRKEQGCSGRFVSAIGIRA